MDVEEAADTPAKEASAPSSDQLDSSIVEEDALSSPKPPAAAPERKNFQGLLSSLAHDYERNTSLASAGNDHLPSPASCVWKGLKSMNGLPERREDIRELMCGVGAKPVGNVAPPAAVVPQKVADVESKNLNNKAKEEEEEKVEESVKKDDSKVMNGHVSDNVNEESKELEMEIEEKEEARKEDVAKNVEDVVKKDEDVVKKVEDVVKTVEDVVKTVEDVPTAKIDEAKEGSSMPCHNDLLEAIKGMNGVKDFEEELRDHGVLNGEHAAKKQRGRKKGMKFKRKNKHFVRAKKSKYPKNRCPWLQPKKGKKIEKKSGEAEGSVADDIVDEGVDESGVAFMETEAEAEETLPLMDDDDDDEVSFKFPEDIAENAAKESDDVISENKDSAENGKGAEDKKEVENATEQKEEDKVLENVSSELVVKEMDSLAPSITSESIAPSVDDSENSQSTIICDSEPSGMYQRQMAESEPLLNKVGIKIKLGGIFKSFAAKGGGVGAAPKKRGRGRPKKAEVKKKVVVPEPSPEPDSPPKKRGPGRPRKNAKLASLPASLSVKQKKKGANVRKSWGFALTKKSEVPQSEGMGGEAQLDIPVEGLVHGTEMKIDGVKLENRKISEAENIGDEEKLEISSINDGNSKDIGNRENEKPMEISAPKDDAIETSTKPLKLAKARKGFGSRSRKSSFGPVPSPAISDSSSEAWSLKTDDTEDSLVTKRLARARKSCGRKRSRSDSLGMEAAAKEEGEMKVLSADKVSTSTPNVEGGSDVRQVVTPKTKVERARKSCHQRRVSQSEATQNDASVTPVAKEKKARKSMGKRRSKEQPVDNAQKSILNYFKGGAGSENMTGLVDNNAADETTEVMQSPLSHNTPKSSSKVRITNSTQMSNSMFASNANEQHSKSDAEEQVSTTSNSEVLNNMQRPDGIQVLTSSEVPNSTQVSSSSYDLSSAHVSSSTSVKTKTPRARKSFNPRSSVISPSSHDVDDRTMQESQSDDEEEDDDDELNGRSSPTESTTSSQGVFAPMTIKVTELESVLGIGNQSLDKMDAKTLDKLVLEKVQRCKSEPLSDSCLPDEEDNDDEEGEEEAELQQGEETGSASGAMAAQRLLKKKRRKYRRGTYNLPGMKTKAIANHIAVNRVKRMYRKRSSSQDSTTSVTSAGSSVRSTRSASKPPKEAVGESGEGNVKDASSVFINVDSIATVPTYELDFETVATAKPSALSQEYHRKRQHKSPRQLFKHPSSSRKNNSPFKTAYGSEKHKKNNYRTLFNGHSSKLYEFDQELEESARRSYRKRKATSDENFLYLPENDGVATDMPIDIQHAQASPSVSKRAKLSGEELFLVHGGDASLQPSPGKPQHVRQLYDGELQAKKKKANLKFVITPNGVMYPVTPPSTPETRGGASTEESCSGSGGSESCEPVRRDEGLPVCCCTLSGITVPNQHKGTFCQALDSVDGKVIGCANKASGNQLFRPAVKIPFMAMCEHHRSGLKSHHCCAGCGHFCAQGMFVECKNEGGNMTHTFHKHCLMMRDDKYHCPHCAAESTQKETKIALTQPLPPSFVFRKEGNNVNARMGSKPFSGNNKDTDIPPAPSLTVNEKEIKFDQLPLGSDRKELELALAIIKDEEVPKRIKVGNKNMYLATKQADLEKVIYLITDGADPNQKFEEHENRGCLHMAAEIGHFPICYFLLKAGAHAHCIDNQLRTPLMEAAQEGHLKIVNLLNKSGAVPDCKGEDGMTALHLAAQSGHCDVVQYLVETCCMRGAGLNAARDGGGGGSRGGGMLNAQDDGGWTPMVWAAEHRHLLTVRYLLRAGTDPNMRDNEDNTALHWAAYAGSVDIAEMFLDAGCDMDAANEHGDRPLHIAARQAHYKCVALFLARGADSESRNNANDAPISCCLDQSSPTWMALRVNKQLKAIAAVKHHVQPERLVHRDISMGRESHPIPVVNGVDQATYPHDFLYVQTSIETSPMNINTALTSLQVHCQCRDNCTSVFCRCGRSSIRCWFNKEGRLTEDFNFLDPPLLFECNKACRCWANCANRVVQLGISCRLQVFKTKGRGWGARTLLDIKKGSYVCEYVGELISDAEADSREDDSYLFDLDNKVEDTYCIDARQYGNIARFINHLCEPNVIPVKVFIDHQDLRFPRICFFASRDIKAYEELGFDYGDKFWIIKWKQFTCECGSIKCRYNKNTIHKTIEDFNARQVEDDGDEPFM